jgi:protein-L-isoaspartate(D-aspartate) O-methyltransferase
VVTLYAADHRGVNVTSVGTARGEYAVARRRLVERLRETGIRSLRLLEAFGQVPRHRFVPDALRDQAYRDIPLLIGDGQTISAPGVAATMTAALRLTGAETVLEVGTGSGYQAAILSELAARVVSIERIPRLAAQARTKLDGLGVTNVVVYLGDGTRGRPDEAPYDRIVVTAGGPRPPRPLLEQLAPGGCLVGPFGERGEQELLRVVRTRDGRFTREVLGRCRFVELIGTHGWAA